jgi:hypothetical protein
MWIREFEELFDLRDAAAHAMEAPKAPIPHPAGTKTTPEQVDYSVESAERSVTFALSVFRWCVDHPRRNIPEAVHWATNWRGIIERLQQHWSEP